MDLESKAVSANREDSETFVVLGDTESSRPYHIFLLQYSESLLFCISPLAFVYCVVGVSQVVPVVKSPPANAGNLGSSPGSGRSLEGAWQHTLVFLPGKSHG